ncbi:thioesterase II family protein [Marininema halotolerans]|nr:thioesterase [Marininema halotolerans]
MKKHIVFCLPYAGGASSLYIKWRHHVHSDVELYPLEYAGRGKRFSEPFYSSMDEATFDLFHRIANEISPGGYSFFGHSMGGLIAYELCRRMMKEGYPPPSHLFLSGVKAPDQPRGKSIHHLPNEEFKTEIQALNGTPQEVIHHPEIFDIFAPILRADFKLIEEYQLIEKEWHISTPITGIYGTEDDVDQEELARWSAFTTGEFHLEGYPGGHFFIHNHHQEIVRRMCERVGVRYVVKR